ncbi:MAG: tripartite tricarboxylate transporter substrate binding protein [Betaproteobacteria bacterium]|nr:MAG: tripartite tricarboxylate transporter substrate binding protein [Betaproteobacteria bacterium]
MPSPARPTSSASASGASRRNGARSFATRISASSKVPFDVTGLRHFLFAALAGIFFSARAADPYPSKPVRIVVAAGAGTVDDVGARIVVEKVSTILGQQFYVENLPGAGGNTGIGKAAKMPADGRVVVVVSTGFIINPLLYPKGVPYDPIKDFAPVTLIAASPNVLTINPQVPARTVQELIALVKANPVDVTQVPYKASPEVVTDLIAGRVDYYITGLTSFLPVKDKLKILAVTTSTRSELVPDVPTMAEAALPGYDMPTWQSIMGPAGMQREHVALLNKAIGQSLASPEVRDRLHKAGLSAASSTPQELRERYEHWMAIFGKIAQDVGLKPQ